MKKSTDIEIQTGNPEVDQVPPKWPADIVPKMRQIYPSRFDIPISQLESMVLEGTIDIAPAFQRRLRWTRKQKSRLVESVIMNVPVPPVFLGEDIPGKWVVLDGRQRLTALHDFLRGDFKLSGLEVWKELNGKLFKDLKKMNAEEAGRPGVKVPLDVAVTRRFIPAIVVLHNSSPEVKYEVFDRLNTGGVIAEPMEVRNAIYRGPSNALLHEIAEGETFRRLWGIPLEENKRVRNAAYKKMVDLEMALRFIGMERYKEFDGRLKDFLTSEMARLDGLPEPQFGAARNRCERALSNAYAALGEGAFLRELDTGDRSTVRSAPLADAILYSMALIEPATASGDSAFFRTVIDQLMRRDLKFKKAISYGTNSTTATRYRIDAAVRALVERAPVQDVALDEGFSNALDASESATEEDGEEEESEFP